jgi:hypothetical protein
MREQIRKVLGMLSPDFEWEKHWEKDDAEGIEAELRKCVELHTPSEGENYHDCGSFKSQDTPKGLYRLFYLLEPRSVDFSNMYRGHLFSFVSADERFLVKVYLYEYELGLYFLAPEDTIDSSGAACVPSAWPGADNRIRCTDPAGVEFFEMVRQAVQHEYEVYPVGDFIV